MKFGSVIGRSDFRRLGPTKQIGTKPSSKLVLVFGKPNHFVRISDSAEIRTVWEPSQNLSCPKSERTFNFITQTAFNLIAYVLQPLT